MNVELYGCLTHPKRQACSAPSFHMHLHRFVLPWSQYKNLLKETWNEDTIVLKSNPSQSLQFSGITWEPQAALITKHIIFWEGDLCQCHYNIALSGEHGGVTHHGQPLYNAVNVVSSLYLQQKCTKASTDNILISPSTKLPGVLWVLSFPTE